MNAPLSAPADLFRLRDHLSSICAPLDEARHLPGDVYSSKEIFALEKEKIFRKHWLCVARVEELSKVGDYLTIRIVGEPVVVAREAEGDAGFAVFRNQCTHRGVEVAFGEGNAKQFQCPYHAWTFDIGGRLLGAPLMKESKVDLTKCDLPRLQFAIWRGWIFATLDPNPQPFADYIGQYEKYLWWYPTDKCKLAMKKVIHVGANWKFLVENLLDFYHASTVHKSTFGKQYKLGNKPLPAHCEKNGAFFLEWDASMRPTDPKLGFFSSLPWLQEKAVTATRGFLFPNMQMSAIDSLRMWSMWPVSETQTDVVGYFILPEESFRAQDFASQVKKFDAFSETFLAEDKVALESLQVMANSDSFKGGPLSRYEIGIHHLLNHYVDVITS